MRNSLLILVACIVGVAAIAFLYNSYQSEDIVQNTSQKQNLTLGRMGSYTISFPDSWSVDDHALSAAEVREQTYAPYIGVVRDEDDQTAFQVIWPARGQGGGYGELEDRKFDTPIGTLSVNVDLENNNPDVIWYKWSGTNNSREDSFEIITSAKYQEAIEKMLQEITIHGIAN